MIERKPIYLFYEISDFFVQLKFKKGRQHRKKRNKTNIDMEVCSKKGK